MTELIAQLRREHIEYEIDYPLSRASTFRIGGNADVVVMPSNTTQFCYTIQHCQKLNIPFAVFGNGSNTLFADEGFRGAIILTQKMNQVCFYGNRVECECGVLLPRLSQMAMERGLAGLEFACGIPGRLGGALCMNAGAYGFEIGDLVESCCILDTDTGKQYHLNAQDLALRYRHSIFMDKHWICLSACLRLSEDSDEAIRSRMQEYMQTRREKQPLEHPSAGSYFKRPDGYFAGALIDECGLKGLTVGNAVVSEKHAGFILNLGGATCADVLELEERICRAVQWKFGIRLEREVRLFPDKEDYGCHLQQK